MIEGEEQSSLKDETAAQTKGDKKKQRSAIALTKRKKQAISKTSEVKEEFVNIQEDLGIFRASVSFLDPNPRRVERIVKVYEIAKSLATPYLNEKLSEREKKIFFQKLFKWLLLCEQWPYRCAWIRQVITDDAKRSRVLQSGSKMIDIGQIYDKVVEQRVYRPQTDSTSNAATSDKLLQRQMDLVNLDSCPHMFRNLLDRFPTLHVSDIGDGLQMNRLCVGKYAINVNPAVDFFVQQCAAHFETQESAHQKLNAQKMNYVSREVELLEEQFTSAVAESAAASRNPAPAGDDTTTTQTGGDENAAQEKPAIAQRESSLNSAENQSVDRLGFDDFGNAIAKALVEPKSKTPVVVGLFATWGSGKSFLLGTLKKCMKAQVLVQVLEMAVKERNDNEKRLWSYAKFGTRVLISAILLVVGLGMHTSQGQAFIQYHTNATEFSRDVQRSKNIASIVLMAAATVCLVFSTGSFYCRKTAGEKWRDGALEWCKKYYPEKEKEKKKKLKAYEKENKELQNKNDVDEQERTTQKKTGHDANKHDDDANTEMKELCVKMDGADGFTFEGGDGSLQIEWGKSDTPAIQEGLLKPAKFKSVLCAAESSQFTCSIGGDTASLDAPTVASANAAAFEAIDVTKAAGKLPQELAQPSMQKSMSVHNETNGLTKQATDCNEALASSTQPEEKYKIHLDRKDVQDVFPPTATVEGPAGWEDHKLGDEEKDDGNAKDVKNSIFEDGKLEVVGTVVNEDRSRKATGIWTLCATKNQGLVCIDKSDYESKDKALVASSIGELQLDQSLLWARLRRKDKSLLPWSPMILDMQEEIVSWLQKQKSVKFTIAPVLSFKPTEAIKVVKSSRNSVIVRPQKRLSHFEQARFVFTKDKFSPLAYFEVIIEKHACDGLYIGLAKTDCEENPIPGVTSGSLGLNARTGRLHGALGKETVAHSDDKEDTEGCLWATAIGDKDERVTIGCGLDYRTREVIFTRSVGKEIVCIGTAQADIDTNEEYRACIAIIRASPQMEIKCNFGQAPFAAKLVTIRDKVVVETPHPYAHNQVTYVLVHVPGAVALAVEFNSESETHAHSDCVRLYPRALPILTDKKDSDQSTQHPPLDFPIICVDSMSAHDLQATSFLKANVAAAAGTDDKRPIEVDVQFDFYALTRFLGCLSELNRQQSVLDNVARKLYYGHNMNSWSKLKLLNVNSLDKFGFTKNATLQWFATMAFVDETCGFEGDSDLNKRATVSKRVKEFRRGLPVKRLLKQIGLYSEKSDSEAPTLFERCLNLKVYTIKQMQSICRDETEAFFIEEKIPHAARVKWCALMDTLADDPTGYRWWGSKKYVQKMKERDASKKLELSQKKTMEDSESKAETVDTASASQPKARSQILQFDQFGRPIDESDDHPEKCQLDQLPKCADWQAALRQFSGTTKKCKTEEDSTTKADDSVSDDSDAEDFQLKDEGSANPWNNHKPIVLPTDTFILCFQAHEHNAEHPRHGFKATVTNCLNADPTMEIGWKTSSRGVQQVGKNSFRFPAQKREVVQANKPISRREHWPVAYFEALIRQNYAKAKMYVGLAPRNVSRSADMPGWMQQSVSVEVKSGKLYLGKGRREHAWFGACDPAKSERNIEVGCGVDFRTEEVFFTCNAECIGSVPLSELELNGAWTSQLYPTVGADNCSERTGKIELRFFSSFDRDLQKRIHKVRDTVIFRTPKPYRIDDAIMPIHISDASAVSVTFNKGSSTNELDVLTLSDATNAKVVEFGGSDDQWPRPGCPAKFDGSTVQLSLSRDKESAGYQDESSVIPSFAMTVQNRTAMHFPVDEFPNTCSSDEDLPTVKLADSGKLQYPYPDTINGLLDQSKLDLIQAESAWTKAKHSSSSYFEVLISYGSFHCPSLGRHSPASVIIGLAPPEVAPGCDPTKVCSAPQISIGLTAGGQLYSGGKLMPGTYRLQAVGSVDTTAVCSRIGCGYDFVQESVFFTWNGKVVCAWKRPIGSAVPSIAMAGAHRIELKVNTRPYSCATSDEISALPFATAGSSRWSSWHFATVNWADTNAVRNKEGLIEYLRLAVTGLDKDSEFRFGIAPSDWHKAMLVSPSCMLFTLEEGETEVLINWAEGTVRVKALNSSASTTITIPSQYTADEGLLPIIAARGLGPGKLELLGYWSGQAHPFTKKALLEDGNYLTTPIAWDTDYIWQTNTEDNRMQYKLFLPPSQETVAQPVLSSGVWEFNVPKNSPLKHAAVGVKVTAKEESTTFLATMDYGPKKPEDRKWKCGEGDNQNDPLGCFADHDLTIRIDISAKKLAFRTGSKIHKDYPLVRFGNSMTVQPMMKTIEGGPMHRMLFPCPTEIKCFTTKESKPKGAEPKKDESFTQPDAADDTLQAHDNTVENGEEEKNDKADIKGVPVVAEASRSAGSLENPSRVPKRKGEEEKERGTCMSMANLMCCFYRSVLGEENISQKTPQEKVKMDLESVDEAIRDNLDYIWMSWMLGEKWKPPTEKNTKGVKARWENRGRDRPSVIYEAMQTLIWPLYACVYVVINHFQHDKPLGESKQGQPKQRPLRYEFTLFNVWRYEGSDLLWMALVQRLVEVTEAHFGVYYSHTRQIAATMLIIAQVVVSCIAVFGAIVLGLSNSNTVTEKFAEISVGAGGLLSFGLAAFRFLKPPPKLSQKLADDITKKQESSALGEMERVKAMLDDLGRDLQSSFQWHPKWRVWRLLVPSCLKAWGDNHFKISHESTRIVLSIDDLDRCKPEKVAELLQATVLILEDLPFCVFMAIDPRIIIESVESVMVSMRDCGISGYQYLDKIIQIPFALPRLAFDEVEQLCMGAVAGESTAPVAAPHVYKPIPVVAGIRVEFDPIEDENNGSRAGHAKVPVVAYVASVYLERTRVATIELAVLQPKQSTPLSLLVPAKLLTPNTSYKIEVKAKNALGYGPQSNLVNAEYDLQPCMKKLLNKEDAITLIQHECRDEYTRMQIVPCESDADHSTYIMVTDEVGHQIHMLCAKKFTDTPTLLFSIKTIDDSGKGNWPSPAQHKQRVFQFPSGFSFVTKQRMRDKSQTSGKAHNIEGLFVVANGLNTAHVVQYTETTIEGGDRTFEFRTQRILKDAEFRGIRDVAVLTNGELAALDYYEVKIYTPTNVAHNDSSLEGLFRRQWKLRFVCGSNETNLVTNSSKYRFDDPDSICSLPNDQFAVSSKKSIASFDSDNGKLKDLLQYGEDLDEPIIAADTNGNMVLVSKSQTIMWAIRPGQQSLEGRKINEGNLLCDLSSVYKHKLTRKSASYQHGCIALTIGYNPLTIRLVRPSDHEIIAEQDAAADGDRDADENVDNEGSKSSNDKKAKQIQKKGEQNQSLVATAEVIELKIDGANTDEETPLLQQRFLL